MARPGLIRSALLRAGAPALLLLGALLPSLARSETVHGTAVDRIDQALAGGRIGLSEAARQKLFYVFDRGHMDARWEASEEPPTRCATLILRGIAEQLGSLDAGARSLYQTYTMQTPDPPRTLAVYETAHFYLEYETTGANGVPATDVSPANGIPDYIEWTATAVENCWTVEIDNLGYEGPILTGGPNNKYLVQFEEMGAYGYTTTTGGGRTKIVQHRNFLGFPPNDDPEGDQIGALKVTFAHEFKHASQFETSGWSEGNWVELDATWVEDIVYDQTNDYYNFISGGGSPFTSPQTTLNPGSYEDCNWEHYQTEKLGNGHMLNFWNRRALMPGEAVLTTYSVNLANAGVPLVDAWGEYVAWNFNSGTRAGTGFGYGEAAQYPTAPATSTHTTLPVPTTNGSVVSLAANNRLINNTGSLAGTPQFTFTGQAGANWSVSGLVKDLAGAVTRVPMTLTSGAGTLTMTGFDYSGLQWAALVIGNANTAGAAQTYSFSAQAAAALFITHQRLQNTTNTTNPYEVTAVVAAGSGTPDPGAVSLTYKVGGGSETTVPMTATGNPDQYSGDIPAQAVGSTIEYRISAETTLDELVSSPGAPGSFYSFDVLTVYEPFEAAGGWTVGDVGDNATTGLWIRVDPVGTIAQPEDDFTADPGVFCFVTGQGSPGGLDGAADVDNGKTTLMSPVFDLSTGGPYTEATVRYRRWYSNHLGGAPNSDTWRVDISNDGGSNWTNLESVTTGNNAWVLVTADLLALFGTPNQVRLRFVAEDIATGSLVEAGVDEFDILAIQQIRVGVGDRGPIAGVRLSLPAPNPSRAGTTLQLALPRAASVSATVRDLQGRQVRRLLASGTRLPAGPNALVWDGRGDGARSLASGVYFVQVDVDDSRLEQRVVLLR